MILQIIQKGKIIRVVKRAVKNAEQEILATMLLSEELRNPLPESYHNLLQTKTLKGVLLSRLGFGTKEEYNQINSSYTYLGKYKLTLNTNKKLYQRMIIIDRKILFFSVDEIFYKSEYAPLVKAFIKYFNKISR